MASFLKVTKKYPPAISPFHIMNEMDKLVKKYKTTYSQFAINPNHENSHIKYFTRTPPENNKPIKVGSLEEMYDQMRLAIKEMSGTNFVLGMLTDEGGLEVWRRTSQPCQGGELRKYGVTHDDSTRPEDPRPGDLTMPFPDGKPLAVGSRIRVKDKAVKLFVNEHSPWRRAYGDEQFVELVSNEGFLIKNADIIDPTMLVSFFKKMRRGTSLGDKYLSLLDCYTSAEVEFMLRAGVIGHESYDSYDMQSRVCASRFLQGGIESSFDLTGGSLGNRFDYNRPDLSEVFVNKDYGKNANPYDIMGKYGKLPVNVGDWNKEAVSIRSYFDSIRKAA